MNYSYAYLFGIDILMFLPAFLILFFSRKDLRKEMLVAGLTFGIVAFLAEPIFLRDYWHPEYIWPFFIKSFQIGSIEDLLYGFLKGGIAAVVFEEVFRKTFSKKRVANFDGRHAIIPIYAGGLALFIVPLVFLRWNSIYTSALAVLVFLAYLLVYRKDLIMDAFWSGLLLVAITFIGYLIVLRIFPDIINAWWKLRNLSGILLAGIPMEEFLESFVVGFFGGPFYEFFKGLRLKKY